MATYMIPLEPEPQSFSIALNGVEYRLTVRWFEAPAGGWLLDMATVDDEPVLSGIPLVAGCDLLEQYEYLGIGGRLVVSGDMPPTLDNLGNDVTLLFEVDDADSQHVE